MAPGACVHAGCAGPHLARVSEPSPASRCASCCRKPSCNSGSAHRYLGAKACPSFLTSPGSRYSPDGCPPSQDSQRGPQCVPRLLCPCPALMGIKRRDKGWLTDRGTGTSTSSTSLSGWQACREERRLRMRPLGPEQDVTLRIATHHCSGGFSAEQSHSQALGHPRNYPSLVGKHPCDLHNSKLLPNSHTWLLGAIPHTHTEPPRQDWPTESRRPRPPSILLPACKACAEANQNARIPAAGQGTGYFLIPALLVLENPHFKAFTPVIQYPGCSSCLPADTRPIKMSFTSLPMMRQAQTPVVRNNLML